MCYHSLLVGQAGRGFTGAQARRTEGGTGEDVWPATDTLYRSVNQVGKTSDHPSMYATEGGSDVYESMMGCLTAFCLAFRVLL